MRVSIPYFIIHVIMLRSLGMHATFIKWKSEMDNEVLNIFFQTLPSDRYQESRMKALWIIQGSPQKNYAASRLQRRAIYLIEQYNAMWKKKSKAEQKKLEEDLSRIFDDIETPEEMDEGNVFRRLLEEHPEYRGERSLIQSVAHKWYLSNASRWRGEFYSSHVDWTPQLKADLLYIADVTKYGTGSLDDRIKLRWSQMHPELNIKVRTLRNRIRELRRENYGPNREEQLEAEIRYQRILRHRIIGLGQMAIHQRGIALTEKNYEIPAQPERQDQETKRITKKRNRDDEPVIHIASDDYNSERHQQKARISAGNGIQQKLFFAPLHRDSHNVPGYYSHDQIMADRKVEPGTTCPHNLNDGFFSGNKRPKDLDLNLPHETDTLFDLNVPYQPYEQTGSSSHQHTS